MPERKYQAFCWHTLLKLLNKIIYIFNFFGSFNEIMHLIADFLELVIIQPGILSDYRKNITKLGLIITVALLRERSEIVILSSITWPYSMYLDSVETERAIIVKY